MQGFIFDGCDEGQAGGAEFKLEVFKVHFRTSIEKVGMSMWRSMAELQAACIKHKGGKVDRELIFPQGSVEMD